MRPFVRSSARVVGGTAAVLLSLLPARAHAVEPPADATADASEGSAAPEPPASYDDLMAEAERSRQAKDHAEAADLHGQAYRSRAPKERFDLTGEITIRAAIADYQLAVVSYSESLEQINAKLALLRAQRALLAEFIEARTPKATPLDIADAFAELDPQIEELERRKAELEAQQGTPVDPTTSTPPPAVILPEPTPDPPEPTVDTVEPRNGRGLLITGAVLTGLGVAGLGMMAGGLMMGSNANDFDASMSYDERLDQFARGRTGNALAIAGAAVGGFLTLTGVSTLLLGVKQRRQSQLALTPMVGRSTAGLGWQGRF